MVEPPTDAYFLGNALIFLQKKLWCIITVTTCFLFRPKVLKVIEGSTSFFHFHFRGELSATVRPRER